MATADVPHPEGLFASRLGSDTTAIRALIPRFATTVRDMIRRGLIEIRATRHSLGQDATPDRGRDQRRARRSPHLDLVGRR